MARKTVKRSPVTDEMYSKVNEDNKLLLKEFIEYLQSIGRSEGTINNYKSDLRILFCWAVTNARNKSFVDFVKKDFIRYQNYELNELGLSPNRIRRMRSAMSSLANYIENICDDEYPDFKNIVNKLEAPDKRTVREKTILEDDECQSLLDDLVKNKKYQQACAFALAWASGRRKSELLRIKKSYIVEENLKFGSMYKTNEKIKTKGKGGGKYIYVWILKNKFKPYFDLWMKERDRLGVPKDMDEMFVVKVNGEWKPASVATLDYYSEVFSKKLNKDFYFHCLRHQFTTELVKSNIPASIIKDIVGWESTDMVDLYTDIDVEDRLEEFFDENGIKEVEQKSIKDL